MAEELTGRRAQVTANSGLFVANSGRFLAPSLAEYTGGMIYLDHAATSPMRAGVREAMLPYLDGQYGNPSGLYRVGREAQAGVDRARSVVAECLGASPAEILFTSGGSESINAAMQGISYAMRRAGAGKHVITTAIEHHAGLHTAQFLEELGFEVTYLGCDHVGRVSVSDVVAALRADTVLVSVMLANNEVGTVQPVAEISGAVREWSKAHGHMVALHTDAVQAPGWLGIDVAELGVDALSLSAHKFGGPKGAGVLYLRRATPFKPLIHGGGQEAQKRAGTENVAGIVGAGIALGEATQGIDGRRARTWELREMLRRGIEREAADAIVNGCNTDCLPNNLNLSFDGIESDALVEELDRRGIAASSGSACSNSTWEPSHVLMAMGVPIRRAVGSVRFSLGERTTEAEVDGVVRVIAEALAGARSG